MSEAGSSPGNGGTDPPASSAGSSGPAEGIPDLVGSVVAGRYRVLELLGRGAMGAVYLARHQRMGREDALKILPRRLASDPDALARFSREARNASYINHRNVCDVYDFGETEDGLPFLAMEYVDGETLGQILEREGPLSTRRLITIMEQVTYALEAAHARGIVHRDLKPDNIMVTRDPVDGSEQVKVVDFGIAKAVEGAEEEQEVTRAGWVVGTPEYVSPEQLSGGEVGVRSDLYSLGVVIFRVLTGEFPFAGETWREIMTSRLTDPPRRLVEVRPNLPNSAALQKVLDRTLSRDPAQRQESATVFREELLGAVRSPEPGGPRASGPPPTRKVEVGGSAPVGGKAEGPSSAGDDGGRFAGLSKGVVTAAGIGVLGGLVAMGALLGWFGDGDEAEPTDPIPMETAQGSSGGQGSPPSDAGGGIRGEGSGDEDPTDVGSGEEVGPGDSGSEEPAPVDRLAPRHANETLFRQLSVITEDGVSGVRLDAARDTAVRAWNRDGLSPEDRALGAYVAANSLLAAGRNEEALVWARRAVDLSPDNRGYRDLLQLLQEGGS